MLITLCGIDGSGKTTLCGLLAAALRERLSREGEPFSAVATQLVTGDSALLRYYRRLVETDPGFDWTCRSYVFAVERVRTAEEVLAGLLRAHDAVVLDRYAHCDIAFARARGQDASIHYAVLDHVPAPDVGIVVDVPVALAMRRILARAEAPWALQENEPLLRAARREYLEVAREFGFTVVDASGPPAETLERVWEPVARSLAVSADA